MDNKINKKFIEILKEKNWDRAVFTTQYKVGGSSRPNITLYFKEIKEPFIGFEVFDIADILGKKYKALIDDPDKRFNKVEIEIFNNGDQNEKFWWDDEKEQEDKLSSANVFYQWINDKMIMLIFEHEKQNKLVPTYLDDDGEIQYSSSWDRGVFTFNIKKKELFTEIKLIKDNEERMLPLSFSKEFMEAILEHHYITNNELGNKWKSWNKLVIKSPHNDIPYNDWENYVTYS